MKQIGGLLESWERTGLDKAPEKLKPKLQAAARKLEGVCKKELKP